MYQINREEVLFDWLSAQSDRVKRQVMLDFMTDLADHPAEIGIRVPGQKPVYVAVRQSVRTCDGASGKNLPLGALNR